MPHKNLKIIIDGTTPEGTSFRPSDWAERISGLLSTFKNHRIYYSPLLRPYHKEGKTYLMVDPSLKDSHPVLFEHIMDFAKANKLKILKKEE